MRRVRYYEHGGPEVLVVEEVDIPTPGPGQALVKSEAIGTGFIDAEIRRGEGRYAASPLPGSPIGDVVGTVEAVGEGVDEALIGQRVVDLVLVDAYADYVLVNADWAVPVPDALDAATASILAMPGPMALHALRVGRLAPGESVLVHSAAGGIGALAVQLAKLEGAGTVIATARSRGKLDLALKQGADHAIAYSDPDWADQVRAVLPNGVDIILDSVGGPISGTSRNLLAPLGRLVIYGFSSGELPELPVPSVFSLRTVTGFSLAEWRAVRPEQARQEIRQVTKYAADGQLHTPVHATTPLANPAQAHHLLHDRNRIGRILITP
jgi:NADPH:quinone reductase